MSIEILARAITYGERVVPEQFVQHSDIVIDDGLLVTVELSGKFRQRLRVIDFRDCSLGLSVKLPPSKVNSTTITAMYNFARRYTKVISG